VRALYTGFMRDLLNKMQDGGYLVGVIQITHNRNSLRNANAISHNLKKFKKQLHVALHLQEGF